MEKLNQTLKAKVDAAIFGPNAYENLKSFVAKNSGKTIHPNHAIILYAMLNIAANAASKQIHNVEANKSPGFQFNLHKKYLGDFNAILERLQVVQPGRTEEYGELSKFT